MHHLVVVDLPLWASVVSSHVVAHPVELFPRVVHSRLLEEDLVVEPAVSNPLELFYDLFPDVVQVPILD